MHIIRNGYANIKIDDPTGELYAKFTHTIRELNERENNGQSNMKNPKGYGRRKVLELREQIIEKLKIGYLPADIYREWGEDIGVTQSTFYRHLITLGLTREKIKGIASSDIQKREKPVDKSEEKTRRMTTKEMLDEDLLESSDKPSFVHNPLPNPDELL